MTQPIPPRDQMALKLARALGWTFGDTEAVELSALKNGSHWPMLQDALEAILPVKPSPGLLMSMAIRGDHAIGCPGYYDQPFMAQQGITHARRLEVALSEAAKQYEEVAGTGFYRQDLEAHYEATAAGTKEAVQLGEEKRAVTDGVPVGYKLVPMEPTDLMLETCAFNLCGEFGEEVVRPLERIVVAGYRELVKAAAAPAVHHVNETVESMGLGEAKAGITAAMLDHVDHAMVSGPLQPNTQKVAWLGMRNMRSALRTLHEELDTAAKAGLGEPEVADFADRLRGVAQQGLGLTPEA